jgi:TatA/E family protein of Tat protein translocase
MVLFISGGEIFIILLFVLIFFGADKIPEFTRMMNKGMREFKKASDDIKREFTENTSGVMNDLRSIQNNLTESLTKEIAEPVQETVKETEKTFEDYQGQVQKTVTEAGKTFDEYQEQVDYYYQNPRDMGSSGNEYRNEAQSSASESIYDSTTNTSGIQADAVKTESTAETPKPKSKPRTAKPKTDAAKSSTKSRSKSPTNLKLET